MKTHWPQLLKKCEVLIIVKDALRQFYNKYFVSDEESITKRFKQKLGRDVVLNNPIKYNDKIQWLKLYWRDPLATLCADKYEVREFVKEQIGEKYLNELIEVYDSVDEIDIKKLPESFVLKGTHGSGYNIICKDKNKMDWKKEFKKMRRWMRNNYYLQTREWVYKDIKPRIVCEKYLEEREVGELRDFKIFCFSGEPKIIQVDIGRFTDHKRNYYDLEWNLLDVEIEGDSDPFAQVPPPKSLHEMIRLSKVLSKDFPHVRVDFYEVRNKVIFGELTFFHFSGTINFEPDKYDEVFGQYLDLSKIVNKTYRG